MLKRASTFTSQSDMSSIQKGEGSTPGLKKSFTMKSSVSDSHAKTFAAVQSTAPPVPKEVNNFGTYLIAIIMCMGAAAYGMSVLWLIMVRILSSIHSGYDTGFFGGTIALNSFQRDFGILDKPSDERDAISANLVSLFQGGSFFGAALQLPFTQRFGRKWSVIVSNIIFIVSGFMQVFADGSLALMSMVYDLFRHARS